MLVSNTNQINRIKMFYLVDRQYLKSYSSNPVIPTYIPYKPLLIKGFFMVSFYLYYMLGKSMLLVLHISLQRPTETLSFA